MKTLRRTGTSILGRATLQFLALIVAIIGFSGAGIAVGTATTTTLGVTPATPVSAGTVVTLTATVVAGSTPVGLGTVTFCNASAAHCEDAAIFGTAQLTSAGTATIKTTLASGTYSITAVFKGAGAFITSTSTAQPLVVSAGTNLGSSTAISQTGSAGNYTLVGTVGGFGKPAPTGTVSFLDASNSNAVVTTAALGTGTAGFNFAAATGSPITLGSNVFPGNEVVGDFNGDGFPDVAVINTQDTSLSTGGTVGILLGKGDGTFQTQVKYAVGTTGSSPNAIAIGDFNGDGKPDLAVVDFIANTLSIFIGKGDGTFQAAVTYATGNTPFSIAVGDFNNDGKLDVAVGNYSDATVGIFVGKGDGTFQTEVPYTVTAGPVWLIAGDFNGDGNADLAAGYPDTGQVGILLGAGNGTFPPDVPYTIGTPGIGPTSIAAGDFNGDGVEDLVVTTEPLAGAPAAGSLGVLLGNANGTFQAPVFYPVGPNPTGLAVADFNSDGKLDIATTNEFASSSSAGIGVLLGKGDGTFQTEAVSAAGASPFALAAADFNRDGLPDLAVINGGDSTASISLDQLTETATATGVAVYGVGTHNVLASYPGDTVHAASQSATTALAGIAQTVTTTVVTASPNPVAAGQTELFTATVTPAPTGSSLGTVSFKNGTTVLGTGNVNSAGVATFSTTSLTTATDSITAVYSGNTAFATSTSTAVSLVVGGEPYSISGPTSPLVIAQRGSGTATITVAPTGGAFNSAVTMSVTGLPPGATGTFTPTSVTPGAAGGTTMLLIQLTTMSTKLVKDHSRFELASFNLAAIGLCGLLFFGKKSSKAVLIVLISFGLAGATMLAGCSSTTDTTTAGNYTVTVTGTNAGSTASTTFTVTVKP